MPDRESKLDAIAEALCQGLRLPGVAETAMSLSTVSQQPRRAHITSDLDAA
jgi:hypothetical protein